MLSLRSLYLLVAARSTASWGDGVARNDLGKL
jgi:hypothetical protein